VQLDRHGAASDKLGEGTGKPGLLEHPGVEAAGEFMELIDGPFELAVGLLEERLRLGPR
jgi:hypothetical protein